MGGWWVIPSIPKKDGKLVSILTSVYASAA